jgi:hypothetical protein
VGQESQPFHDATAALGQMLNHACMHTLGMETSFLSYGRSTPARVWVGSLTAALVGQHQCVQSAVSMNLTLRKWCCPETLEPVCFALQDAEDAASNSFVRVSNVNRWCPSLNYYCQSKWCGTSQTGFRFHEKRRNLSERNENWRDLAGQL